MLLVEIDELVELVVIEVELEVEEVDKEVLVD